MKFYYLPAKIWRGEVARMLFHLGGLEVEDIIVKPEDIARLQKEGIAPHKQVPVLEVDGKILTQSGPIIKYLAIQAGFMPTDEFLRAKVDEIFHLVDQITSLVSRLFTVPEAGKEAEVKYLADVVFPQAYETLDRIIGKNDYLVGNSLSAADLLLYSLTFSIPASVPKDMYKKYGGVNRVVENVGKDKRIIEYKNKNNSK